MALSLALEVLHGALVSFCGFPSAEGSEITPPAGLRIFLA